MTTTIIITFCSLLLIAYLFDLTFKRTRIPSVILLLLLGWLVRQLTVLLNIQLPSFQGILPVFGTIGLILIVLEGALELELNRSKIGLIRKSFFGALLPLLALSFMFAYLFHYFGYYDFKDSLTNAIPLCVISSAIAIPSVRNLSPANREFVIYESSLSDILGVIFFNFVSRNETFGLDSFGHFGLQLVIVTVVSFVATIGLSLLLSKIEHHIKFVPIILLIILIYSISYVYHLPALVFILLFGLSIGNVDRLQNFRWMERFHPEVLKKEVQRFKELTFEAAFLIRSLFFLLFGYLLETPEILNTETLIWSIVIVVLIFSVRAIQLAISGLPLKTLLFVAPRGLITVLLFLHISPLQKIAIVNKSMIIQIIILTALIMMLGIVIRGNKGEKKEQALEGETPQVSETDSPVEH